MVIGTRSGFTIERALWVLPKSLGFHADLCLPLAPGEKREPLDMWGYLGSPALREAETEFGSCVRVEVAVLGCPSKLALWFPWT